MKNIKFLLIGVLVGILLSTSFVFAEPIKQFILTQSNVPLLVNGKEYTPKNPILNYNGTTYVPLKELGSIVGVKVEWNDKEKRIEVGGNPTASIEKRIFIKARDLSKALDDGKYGLESTLTREGEQLVTYIGYKEKRIKLEKDQQIYIYQEDETYYEYDALLKMFDRNFLDQFQKYEF